MQADQWLERLQRDISALSASTGTDIQIASGGGRMRVTMDRYGSDWAIVKRGWEAHVLGQAPNRFRDAVAGVRGLQVRDGVRVSDQQLEPWVVVDGTGSPVGPIVDGDAVVTFNFRADRMVEICQAFEDETFTAFDRQRWPQVRFAGMMVYDNELGLPKHYLVPPPVIENASEEYLLASGCKVFATAESQKIGHVTFFWRGNKGGAVPGAKYVEVASDTGISFNTAPEMKAKEVAATARDAILSKQYSVVRCNFANPDMVAHTGSLEATVRACTTVDACVAQLLSAVDAVGGRWLVTADHGNAEEMVQRDKAGAAVMDAQGRPVPLTSHTLNPVPCAIGGAGLPPGVRFREDLPPSAGLANVAATYMNLLGFEAPPFYEPSLVTVD